MAQVAISSPEEFPCTPSAARQIVSVPSSPVSSGSEVHITGVPDEQAVFVRSYGMVSSVPNMTIVTVSQGQIINIAKDSPSPQGLDVTNGCTLRTGCFGNGIPRAVTTLTDGARGIASLTTQLPVGTLFPFSNFTVTLVSLQNGPTGTLYSYLIAEGK